jgi:cysteine-rich repeat protein
MSRKGLFSTTAVLVGCQLTWGCNEEPDGWAFVDAAAPGSAITHVVHPSLPGDAASDASTVPATTVDASIPAAHDSAATEPSVCGNGVVESGEECDDGNDEIGDACIGCVVVPLCGNGVVEPGEGCDALDAAVCDRCMPVAEPECGNGVVESGEECDSEHESCVECRLYTALCGDAITNGDDECDDGNDVEDDGCDNLCRVRKCGDGIVQTGEQCDPPGATCTNQCQTASEMCGDGDKDSGEQCDDGNTATGDGCFNCMNECGDGVVDPQIGEACEPGKAKRRCRSTVDEQCFVCAGNEPCEARDICSATCQPNPVCGNGVLEESAGEECDPPGSATCDTECHVIPAECGNEIVEAAEHCDPPDGVTCSQSCTHLGCGNGTLEGAEECEPPGVGQCDDSCKVIAPCIPSAASNLLPQSGFDENIEGFIAQDERVTLSHDTTLGDVALGALLVTLDNGGEGGPALENRGASLCLPATPHTLYTLSGSYRFPEGASVDSATNASLRLYTSDDCTGNVLDALRGRGPKASVTQAWTRYSVTVNTDILEAAGSMSVRLDVWRPSTLPKAAVYWDDVALTTPASGPACGNCEVETGEACDDGSPLAGDGCSVTCQLEECGNGLVDVGEVCDDGNAAYNDGCDPDCTFGSTQRSCAFTKCSAAADACYNVPASEVASDDGTSAPSCGNLADCIQETGCAGPTALAAQHVMGVANCYCGTALGANCLESGAANGMCKAEFETAFGTADPGLVLQRIGSKYGVFAQAATLIACSQVSVTEGGEPPCYAVQTCGDGRLQERAPEYAMTQPGWFDGVVQSPITCGELTEGAVCYPAGSCGCLMEECDDGNAIDGDGCDSRCFVETCGNGVLQPGLDPLLPAEECDDGNQVDDDGCSASCEFERICGNDIAETGEQCEDGNLVNGDGCDDRCYIEECGNGRLQAGEDCEPPNTTSCDAQCNKLLQDECTECVLRADAYADPNGMVGCFGKAFLTESPAVPPSTENGLYCLDNEPCAALWQCYVDTRCWVTPEGLSVGNGSACYCGAGVDIITCGQDSHVPFGPCLDEIRAAYEAQFQQVIPRNGEFLERMFELDSAAGSYASLGIATTAAVTCINGHDFLDSDLCYSGVSRQDRLQCSKACFGETGAVTEQTALTDTCEAPPPAVQ